MATAYDDIIVGAGSSGAVLAARLSEDPSRRVLLLEAGPDYASIEATPPDLRDSTWISVVHHDWGFKADAVKGREIEYPRGKVMGGSSAVNATIALRGVPADYDEWASLGNTEWAWSRVLPYFRKLGDDQDEGGPLHGRGGPIPVRRWRPSELVPLQQAYLDAGQALGFGQVTDHNHPEATGIRPWPMNQRDGLRLSTAIGYLLPARQRQNLTIRPDCLVSRVVLEGKRAHRHPHRGHDRLGRVRAGLSPDGGEHHLPSRGHGADGTRRRRRRRGGSASAWPTGCGRSSRRRVDTCGGGC